MEDAQGGLAGTNFSTAGEQDETSTMIFRGAQVVMQQCDVRCVGGSCLRLHNGRSMELELDRECGMTYLDWDDNSDEETGTVRGMTRPDIPSYVNMLQCGLGGDDPRVEDFVANLDDDVCRAQSCIDLFDDCAAELQRSEQHSTPLHFESPNPCVGMRQPPLLVLSIKVGALCFDSSILATSLVLGMCRLVLLSIRAGHVVTNVFFFFSFLKKRTNH